MIGRRIKPPTLPSAIAHRVELENYEKNIKSSYLWGAVNSLLLAFLLFDLTYGHVIHGAVYHTIQVLLVIFFGLNIIFHISRIGWLSKELSMRMAVTAPTPVPSDTETIDDEEFTCFQSAVYDIVNTEQSHYWSSASPANFSYTGSFNSTSPFDTSNTTKVCSLSDVERYLKEFNKTENTAVGASSIEPHSVGVNQYVPGADPVVVSPVFRRTLYQSSYCSSDSGHSLNEDGGSPVTQHKNELWQKYKIDPSLVVNWVSNLRMWISSTILQRIVNEIDDVNNHLNSYGLSGLAVGSIGLDTLKNTAHSIVVFQFIPSLAFLIPFLEVSSNQEYVVQRIRELAVGSNMSDFKWKSGNNCWDTHLPTDTEIIMHVVSTYFDSQLPLLPSDPAARPFTSQYIVKSKDQMKQIDIVIYQQTANPPHYQLIINNVVQDIPPGRNNLFYTLLLFIHYVKTYKDGILERITLGPSGINMLWIVSSIDT